MTLLKAITSFGNVSLTSSSMNFLTSSNGIGGSQGSNQNASCPYSRHPRQNGGNGSGCGGYGCGGSGCGGNGCSNCGGYGCPSCFN